MSAQRDKDELREKIKFDRDALDDAIEEQADLYREAADAFALAVSHRDEAKSEMEQEYARACDRARENVGEGRVTEAAVKESAAQSKRYLAAEKRWRDLKLEADYAAGLRDSFDARGKMLREMAQLWIAGYFQISGVKARRRDLDYADAERGRQAMSEKRKARGKRQ